MTRSRMSLTGRLEAECAVAVWQFGQNTGQCCAGVALSLSLSCATAGAAGWSAKPDGEGE